MSWGRDGKKRINGEVLRLVYVQKNSTGLKILKLKNKLLGKNNKLSNDYT
jgi:hypothetical protein